MTAKIKGFVSRAEAGLPAPRSVSRNVTPQRGGIAVHHGGPAHAAARPKSDHSTCIQTWFNWHRMHTRSHGWVDIGYNIGFCNHGYAFAGRGYGVRPASQGTNDGNRDFLSAVWIGGEGQKVTKAGLDALDWILTDFRGKGAGNAVRPHSFFRATGCPLKQLVDRAAERHNTVSFEDAPVKKTATKKATSTTGTNQVRNIQSLLGVTSDGKWGPITDRRAMEMRNAARARRGWPNRTNASFNTRMVQGVVKTPVDGIWGPNSQAAMTRWVNDFQRALNVKADGWWGPKTDGKLIQVRRRYLNRF